MESQAVLEWTIQQGLVNGDAVKDIEKNGTNPYGVDDQDYLTTKAFKGRTGLIGKTFTGHYNPISKVIRIDCAEEPTFYLEIDLNKTNVNIPQFQQESGK